MKKKTDIHGKLRIGLYLDSFLANWIMAKSDKLGLSESAFARMLLLEAYNKEKDK